VTETPGAPPTRVNHTGGIRELTLPEHPFGVKHFGRAQEADPPGHGAPIPDTTSFPSPAKVSRGATMAIELTDADESEVEEFAGRLFNACLATMELANVELGIRLNLYEALAGAGPMTAGELARRAGIRDRYAREWLEQQAVAGVVSVDDPARPADERQFQLSDAHAHVLLDDDSEACMKPCAAVAPWVAKAIDIMVEEFRSGTGAAFGLFDLHDIQAAFTRPVFVNHLTQNWLPALPEVQSKLDAGEPVRIAEVGCGEGLAAITIARAFPNAVIDGYDLDDASITAARKAASEAGVADRARFEVRDAADPTINGDYDLVMAIEMIHDVPDPVGILGTMATLAGQNGTVLVVDERTEESFTVPSNEMERLFYSFSTLHCLAVSMQNDGVGTGTVIRPDTMRGYAREAGFSTIETLDVEHPQFLLYRLS
jgi:2-polyprenyl-3-methyl-5-hydroxy-6-metoxy-1,4-benzoquinol methylase